MSASTLAGGEILATGSSWSHRLQAQEGPPSSCPQNDTPLQHPLLLGMGVTPMNSHTYAVARDGCP